MKDSADLPILYSLRNCPYAMRARIAIFKSKQCVKLRDIVLSNKPAHMLRVSPKGTVPVLVLSTSQPSVLEESFDIMLWALNKSDPNDLLHAKSPESLDNMLCIIQQFDDEFKANLEAYKCAKRYHEDNLLERRQSCEQYIQRLEQRLNEHLFLMSEKESLLDIALFPYLRQFARVERQWYLQSPYPKLKQWLNNYLQSPMFNKVMAKHPLWQDSHETVYFSGS